MTRYANFPSQSWSAARSAHTAQTQHAHSTCSSCREQKSSEGWDEQKENCISNSILVFPGITRIAVATQTWKRKFYEQYQRGKPVRLSTEKIKFLSWTIWPVREQSLCFAGGGGLISYKAGKAKQMEKRSARSRLVKQVFFYITK